MVLAQASETGGRQTGGYRTVLHAFGVSSLGDGIRTAAIPLLATLFTTDPVAIGGLAIAGRIPWLLVALMSGAIVDRHDRRWLMATVDLCRAVAVVGLVVSIMVDANHLLILYAVAFLLGVGETLFDTATQGLLPEIVPPEQLGKANGHTFSINLVGGSFAGPALGSWLFSVSRALPFVVDALSFAISALLLSLSPTSLRQRRDPAKD